MTSIDTILDHFRKGRITRGESLTALARMITPANVTKFMADLPGELAADVERWVATVPAQGGVVIGANLSGEEGRRIAEDLQVASQAVRAWAARREIEKAPMPDGNCGSLDDDDCDPLAIGGVDATGDGRKIVLLVGPDPGSPNVFVLCKLHLSRGRAIYLYNLLNGEMKHLARPSQEMIDKYLALGRRIDHPSGIDEGATQTWVEYGRQQAQRLGLKVAS